MTKKKDLILHAALECFAEKGYHTTSTNSIAKIAGVSEGLIFKHYGNKEGLLKAILVFGQEKAALLFEQIDSNNSAQQQLKDIISIPFNIAEEDFSFWKLIYSLKWQTVYVDDGFSDLLKNRITDLLKQLNFKKPETEAELILLFFNGAASSILLNKPINKQSVLNTILDKYNLQ